jgi:hypothetical protein
MLYHFSNELKDLQWVYILRKCVTFESFCEQENRKKESTSGNGEDKKRREDSGKKDKERDRGHDRERNREKSQEREIREPEKVWSTLAYNN